MSRSGPGSTRAWALPVVALAVAVYTPLLLSSPGVVVADTKTYLYLDPGRLLGRALSMWDPHVGMGTVPHQQIGYLWPMGPYYWIMEQVGAPDWVAQRLWIGSIMFAAGAGVMFLGRTWRWRPEAAAAAAFVYGLSPYVLTLAARISVILLAFAGLPWLLALTIRSLRTPGWRHPALFALVVATIGSINATALLLVGIVPVAWILYALWRSPEVTRARATSTVIKIGVLTLAVNLWWISGLSVQATNGIDVLRYTETAEVIADASTGPEVLRGLGYWFFYGGDRLGPWIEPGESYTQDLWLIALTYGIAIAGLFALGVSRWRDRMFVIGMLAVGTIIAVGAHPWVDPSPVGELFKLFLGSDLGLAMRSLPRAVPLVALAIALGIGSVVGAASEQVPRRGIIGAVLVAVVAYAALPPLWTGGFVPDNLQRPEDIPGHWHDAAAYLDERDDGTRVLEIPGIDFASYRWGNTVDPITPGLMDRPLAARELIPYGSPPSADLLNALDLRMQELTLEPEAIAVVARLLGVGDVLLRNDLQYERYNTPRPRSLWELVSGAPGLGEPVAFGPDDPNVPIPEAPLLDEEHLVRDALFPDPPAIGVFPVEDPVQIVHTHGGGSEVHLSGDGAGIVDAAMAGLLRGDELLRYSASITEDPDFVRDDLRDDRALIVTDTNRRQAERWTTVRHTRGYTELADGGLLGPADPSDQRLPLFDDRPGTESVAEHRGVSVRATGYGNPITYTPEERPVNAIDGDPRTAWRTAAFDDAVGERIELVADSAVRTDHIDLLQPVTGEINRWITEVELRFDGEDPLRVTLDESSRTEPGQRITFDTRTFETLSIEIEADSAGRRPGYSSLTSVGFAEIGLADLTAEELIRMPSDLLDAGGYRTVRYPLALVQTRERAVATDVTRADTEPSMARIIELPAARSYALSGSVRLAGTADSPVLDAILGRPGLAGGRPTVEATSVLPGGFAHRPSNAFDGDPATWWTSQFGSPAQEGLLVRAPEPVTFDRFDLTFVDDPLHSVPASVLVEADGADVGTVDLAGPVANGDGTATATVVLPGEVTATEVGLSFPDVEVRTAIDWNSNNPEALPIAIAEVGIEGVEVGPAPEQVDTGCRADLVTIDGDPVEVRVTGATADALLGKPLAIEACGPVDVMGGERVFRTTPGRETGLDVDQLVWCSAGGGAACEEVGPLLPEPAPGPRVRVTGGDDATVEVRISGATPGEPFWLVLGQSQNPGWEIVEEDVEHGPSELVDGYANGFEVTPSEATFDLTLRFVPQNRVDVALLLSAVSVPATFALALLSRRRRDPAALPLQEPIRRLRATTWEGALPTRRDAVLVGVGVGVAVTFLVHPLGGAVTGLLAGFATRREGWRPVFTFGAPLLLTTCLAYLLVFQVRNDIGPGLHWPSDTGRLHSVGLLAVAFLVVDVVIARVWARRSHLR